MMAQPAQHTPNQVHATQAGVMPDRAAYVIAPMPMAIVRSCGVRGRGVI